MTSVLIRWANNNQLRVAIYYRINSKVNTTTNITETWYRFRIPNYQRTKVGQHCRLPFHSIHENVGYGFWWNVTLHRFCVIQLGRNNWRRDSSLCLGIRATSLILDKVDIEENSGKLPFNYVLQKVFSGSNYSVTTANVFQNEAGLLMRKSNFLSRCTQTITKITDLDVRRYERFKMFVHAEDVKSRGLEGDLKVFVRVGSWDFTSSYYEYEIPVRVSTPNAASVNNSDSIWLDENDFDFPLKLFIDLKNEPNKNGVPFNMKSITKRIPKNQTILSPL